MKSIPGMRPTSPGSLVRASDRISFLYLEHCIIEKDSSALTATNADGVLHIPSATLSVLMLGPGTKITHQAMCVVADSGMCVIWVGEEGVRYYAHGRPIGRGTKLLEAQAKIVSNQQMRMIAARTMYGMRWPGEDTSKLTMQQLRGREGARVKRIYAQMSKKYSIIWDKRQYKMDDFTGSDPINMALSAAHTSLYGLTHAAIVALGCAPGLGVFHCGHDRAFVYDIADLYKADVTIPIAFEAAAAMRDNDFPQDELPSYVRRACRDKFKQEKLGNRIVRDIKTILLQQTPDADDDNWYEEGLLALWDPTEDDPVPGGYNYATDAS